jgi:hypothetical protein
MMSYTLKPNSITNEYYCGDLPGSLQYKKNAMLLSTLSLPANAYAKPCFIPIAITDSIKARLLPATKTAGAFNNWVLLMAMERVTSTATYIKGALQNKKTGSIALMTTCSKKEDIQNHGHRAIQSQAKDWYVGFYRMSAPIEYWSALKKVLEETNVIKE